MTSTSTGIMSGMKRDGCGIAVPWLAVAIVLAWASVCAAGVMNPSFETYYLGTPYPRQLPSSWWHTDHPSFNSKCTSQWSTESDLSAGLYSLVNKPINPGNFEGFHQFVNLTGIGSIVFDVRLVAYPSGKFEHFKAVLLVDGDPVWSQTQDGAYLNQQVNVGNKAGYHRVEMGITALDGGAFPLAYWTQWDNIRLVEGAEPIKASIVLDPNALNLSSNGRWITCYIELEPGYNPHDIDGGSVKLGDSVTAYIVEDGPGWAAAGNNYENVSDFDDDDVDERMVKFDRSQVQALVGDTPEAILTVKGNMVGGAAFEGTGVIRVIDKGGPSAK
jgi:hypothetical protein